MKDNSRLDEVGHEQPEQGLTIHFHNLRLMTKGPPATKKGRINRRPAVYRGSPKCAWVFGPFRTRGLYPGAFLVARTKGTLNEI